VDERFKIVEKNGIINSVKSKYGIEKPFIFFVGVWRNHKNLEGLIAAYEIIREKYNFSCQLVLGGQADERYEKPKLKIQRSKFQSDIITTGYLPDEELPLLYNAATVFCLPSFLEGFGLIAIEAENCGCPVAASNTGSLPEVLGDSALFFDPHDPEAMAAQLFKILTDADLRNDLIAKGLGNVKRFSWEKCARETLAVYRRCF
jgi:glycosyltransferase involved in cell wall biosynthesis